MTKLKGQVLLDINCKVIKKTNLMLHYNYNICPAINYLSTQLQVEELNQPYVHSQLYFHIFCSIQNSSNKLI